MTLYAWASLLGFIDQISVSLGDLAQVAALIFALFWGATKLKHSVARLDKTAEKLEQTLQAICEDLSNHHTRLAVIEDRLGVPHPRRNKP